MHMAKEQTPTPTLTTNSGAPVEDSQNSITAGLRDPMMLQERNNQESGRIRFYGADPSPKVSGLVIDEDGTMKPSYFSILTVVLLLGACAQTEPSHLTDLSIDKYRPPPNALSVAETRAKEYLAKHQQEIGRGTKYLGIESDSIFPDEIRDLDAKLINSPGVNSSDIEEYEENDDVSIYCVNIFDTRTGRIVDPDGYAVVDLPARGNVARFGKYTARFIGTGG
jgi:hypothetical protein